MLLYVTIQDPFMKTTLPKLCFFAFLFVFVSCAKKAFIYSENLTKNFIGKTFDEGFISETNKPNNQVMSMNNNVGSYSVDRSFSSISNYYGSSASASASASVIAPATLSKTEDLVFGKVFLKHLKNKFVSLNEIGASFQRILVPNVYISSFSHVARLVLPRSQGALKRLRRRHQLHRTPRRSATTRRRR